MSSTFDITKLPTCKEEEIEGYLKEIQILEDKISAMKAERTLHYNPNTKCYVYDQWNIAVFHCLEAYEAEIKLLEHKILKAQTGQQKETLFEVSYISK